MTISQANDSEYPSVVYEGNAYLDADRYNRLVKKFNEKYGTLPIKEEKPHTKVDTWNFQLSDGTKMCLSLKTPLIPELNDEISIYIRPRE